MTIIYAAKSKKKKAKQALLCSVELASIKCNLMKVRNGQNWHSSVGKYVHHNRETAKIGFRTSLKLISISGFVDTRDKVNAH